MNELNYKPEYRDRDAWEHTMFRICDPPPKLPAWQDYFTQKDERSFLFFLHYYEPELNKLVSSFVSKYGLTDRFGDVKMVCVEELLRLWQKYDPSAREDFLDNIQVKLAKPMLKYAMANLKGFSETSATHYYQLRKAAAIYKNNQYQIPYGEIVRMICDALDVKGKTALRLLQEMDALDTFQWYGGIRQEGEGIDLDVPMGVDVLGYGHRPLPEQAAIRNEILKALTEAFEELDEKEQDVIGLHLGFCHNCLHPQEPKTYDEIADIYQFTTVNGVQRFYKRAIEKLRSKLTNKGFYALEE